MFPIRPLLLVLFLLASFHGVAQSGEESEKEEGKKKQEKKGKEEEKKKDSIEVRLGEDVREEYYYDMPAYNFFIGPDAGDFQTTILGFGSGFLLDIFSGRHSGDFLEIGTEDYYLSLGWGISIMKYRFKDNLVLSSGEERVEYGVDPNPAHKYSNSFFGRGKSKMVTGSVFLPLNLNLKIGPFNLRGGGFADLYISGKHKRKYKEDGSDRKNKLGHARFSSLPLHKIKYGVQGAIIHKSGYGVQGYYTMTPFFKTQAGPELYQVHLGITIPLEEKE